MSLFLTLCFQYSPTSPSSSTSAGETAFLKPFALPGCSESHQSPQGHPDPGESQAPQEGRTRRGEAQPERWDQHLQHTGEHAHKWMYFFIACPPPESHTGAAELLLDLQPHAQQPRARLPAGFMGCQGSPTPHTKPQCPPGQRGTQRAAETRDPCWVPKQGGISRVCSKANQHPAATTACGLPSSSFSAWSTGCSPGTSRRGAGRLPGLETPPTPWQYSRGQTQTLPAVGTRALTASTTFTSPVREERRCSYLTLELQRSRALPTALSTALGERL